jgi:phage tail-like protein
MNYRPPVGYFFSVSFLPDFNSPNIDTLSKDAIDANFKEVSGLTSEIQVDKFQEGGANGFQHPLPKPASFTNINLKRGLLIKSELANWMIDALENFKIVPKEIIVMLMGPEGKAVAAWHVSGAFPVKWEISGFNAMDNAIVIETIDLTCQKHRRLTIDSAEDVLISATA